MIDNRLKVLTKFADSGQGPENLQARVYFDGGEYQFINNNNSFPVFWFPNDNRILNIEVFDGKEPVDPTDPSRGLYIKFNSKKGFTYNVSTTKRGWTISKKKPCLFSREPVLVSKLPKSLNKWYFRLMLLPVEAAWFLIKAPVVLTAALFQLSVSVIGPFFSEANPETTNVTVGDEEE